MAKSKMVMDTGVRAVVVAAEYLSSPVIVEPPWLNYAREWGPKISYDIAEEIKKVEKFLPGTLKRAFEKFIRGLPNEVLGEEGPTGPKMKNNWNAEDIRKRRREKLWLLFRDGDGRIGSRKETCSEK
ncbi:hypothetical protein RJ639_003067, partial [Escallonia herrerae]